MSKRTEIAARIPWVTRLDEPSPGGCCALKSSTPLKALYSWGAGKANPPVGTAAYRCRNSARWHFEALDPEDEWEFAATTGDYCWVHLIRQGLHGTYRETQRTQAWLHANGYLE